MNDYQTIERYPITYRSNVVHSAFQEMRYRKCTNGFLPKNKKWTLEARCFKSPHIKRFPRFGVRKVLLSIRGFSFRGRSSLLCPGRFPGGFSGHPGCPLQCKYFRYQCPPPGVQSRLTDFFRSRRRVLVVG